MEFLLTNDKHSHGNHQVKFIWSQLFYSCKHKIGERDFIIENDKWFFAGEANLAFIRKMQMIPEPGTITKERGLLNNGFVIAGNRKTGGLTLYNDIFGFYPLYLFSDGDSFAISEDFSLLHSFSRKEADPFALADILLFNYALADRTVNKNIRRIPGGATITIAGDKPELTVNANYAENISLPAKQHRFFAKEAGETLKGHIEDNLITAAETNLTMSGGFDSRVLLAACTGLNLQFNSFTFGQPGNLEQATIEPFIHNYTDNHKLFPLDHQYLENLQKHFVSAIKYTLASPAVQDLVHYAWIRESLKGGNIIAGYMGGEIITGQSLGAGVTFTPAAAALVTAGNVQEIKEKLMPMLRVEGVFNQDTLEMVEDEYFDRLALYLPSEKNNILRFLINEKFAKFFGIINLMFRNHSNLITPFMSEEYLSYMLGSNLSILNTGILNLSSLHNFTGRRAYARIVKTLNPSLAKTRLDRLYRIDDLCQNYRLPLALLNYSLNHLFDRNKKKYLRPHHYDLWYNDLIEKMAEDGKINYNNIEINLPSLQTGDYGQLPPFRKKIMANILALYMAEK